MPHKTTNKNIIVVGKQHDTEQYKRFVYYKLNMQQAIILYNTTELYELTHDCFTSSLIESATQLNNAIHDINVDVVIEVGYV